MIIYYLYICYILIENFMQWHYQSNPNSSPPSCKLLALPVHTQKDQMTQYPPRSIFFGHPPTAAENHCRLKLQTIRHFLTVLFDLLTWASICVLVPSTDDTIADINISANSLDKVFILLPAIVLLYRVDMSIDQMLGFGDRIGAGGAPTSNYTLFFDFLFSKTEAKIINTSNIILGLNKLWVQ